MDELNSTIAPRVENDLLAIRQYLPAFPMLTRTTIAHRPAAQRKRKGAGGGGAASTRPSVMGGGAAAAQSSPPRRADIIQISDSDVPESNFHFNDMTQRMEYMSSEADENMSNSEDSDAPPLAPFRRTFVDGAWLIGSQRDPSAI